MASVSTEDPHLGVAQEHGRRILPRVNSKCPARFGQGSSSGSGILSAGGGGYGGRFPFGFVGRGCGGKG